MVDGYRDLSHRIETGMRTFPGDPDVSVTSAATIPEDGFSVQEIRCGSHTGTHIDAPSHTEPDGGVLADRPIGQYVFTARFRDVTPCSAREPIGPDRLPDGIDDPDVDIVVLRTGWDEYWATDHRENDRYLDHPYLLPAAARRLREANCGVAVDSLNPDPTPTPAADPDEPDGFPVHHALLGSDLPIIENLTALSGLPERFVLYAFPLPIADGDGAPVRAVARVS
ncbi:cyclase family protein [Halopenitus sp. H-Gu1]|uniref:cyclase family protein n=1 Tax=Halopenitus sp. H-Gu1 TaxID=3242697 RepID=UPI00359DC012